MQEQAISKEQTKTEATIHEIENVDSELYKVGMYTTAAFASIIGGWGLVCLSSALLQDGGPMQMIKSLFQAISGM